MLREIDENVKMDNTIKIKLKNTVALMGNIQNSMALSNMYSSLDMESPTTT